MGMEYDPYASPVQKEPYRRAIELGVDLVIGSHPHIPQEYEIYKGKPIFYSVGNAIFDQEWGYLT